MQTQRQPQPGQTHRADHSESRVNRSPTLTIMPFADAEEERLWDEIARRRQR